MFSLIFSILALGMGSYALVVALNTQDQQLFILRDLHTQEQYLQNLKRDLRRK